jgi:Chromo (CHRromatin Organisation MOdifier) domain
VPQQEPTAKFTEGQKVWLEGRNIKTFHPSSKLAPKHHGPFIIASVISPVAYKLVLPSHWKIHNIFYTDLLTHYKETDAHGPNFTSPPPEIIEGKPEYEVECILASHCFGRRRKLQYLVKWLGYPLSENSWQDTTDVHALDLVREFQACHQPSQHWGAARPRRGVISCYSSMARPSTLQVACVTIPQRCAGPPDHPKRTKTRSTTRVTTRQKRYDESTFLAQLAEALRRHGAAVHTARTSSSVMRDIMDQLA